MAHGPIDPNRNANEIEVPAVRISIQQPFWVPHARQYIIVISQKLRWIAYIVRHFSAQISEKLDKAVILRYINGLMNTWFQFYVWKNEQIVRAYTILPLEGAQPDDKWSKIKRNIWKIKIRWDIRAMPTDEAKGREFTVTESSFVQRNSHGVMYCHLEVSYPKMLQNLLMCLLVDFMCNFASSLCSTIIFSFRSYITMRLTSSILLAS